MRIKLAEEVFGLIKGLSRTEKAYVKKRGFGKSDSKLGVGFDIINAANDFDEKSIAQKLEAQKIDPREVYKRLLPIILKSLSQYHSGSSPELELNEIIISARLLINRKQRTLGLREIERGIEIAKANEHHPSLVELNRLKQAALRISHTPTTQEDTDNYLDSLKAVRSLEKSIHLDYLYRKVSGLFQEGFVSKAMRNQLLTEILDHPAVKDESDDSYRTYVLRLRIQTACYYFSGQWEKAIQTGIKLLEGMPQFDEGTNHNIRMRMVMIMDLMNMYQLTYDRSSYVEAKEQFAVGMGYTSAFFDLAASKMEMGLALAELTNALLSGQLQEAERMAEELLEKTDPQLLVPIIKKRMMISLVLTYFYSEKYTKAIHYINTEFPFSDSDAVNDRARWLELLCCFHSEDEVMFESRWLSWNRQLKKFGSGYEWEELVMKALKQCYGRSKQEMRPIMAELHQKLLPMKLELRTSLEGEFDFLTWAESLAAGRPMILLLKEKYLSLS